MYCTKCGLELREEDVYCSRCGIRTAQGTVEIGPPRPLMLDKANKKVAGVCAGFARYFDVDVVLMRVLWLAVSICTGVGFIAYLVAWMVMPADDRLPAGSRVQNGLISA
jgi:phage shock protein C